MAHSYNNITFSDLITEMQRELTTRRRVYPKWQMTGQIRAETAYHRIKCIESILYLLRKNAPKPPEQMNLFETFTENKNH